MHDDAFGELVSLKYNAITIPCASYDVESKLHTIAGSSLFFWGVAPMTNKFIYPLPKTRTLIHPFISQILTKMYMEQIVSMHEMETFEKGLMEHQKAQTGNGLTIPTRAVIEHNLVAASSIYDNVYFEELGRLLDINPDQAERMIAQMISEGRLSGSIDQVSGLVQFELQVEKLHRWDDRIADACNQLTSCVIDVVSKYPDFERALYTST